MKSSGLHALKAAAKALLDLEWELDLILSLDYSEILEEIENTRSRYVLLRHICSAVHHLLDEGGFERE